MIKQEVFAPRIYLAARKGNLKVIQSLIHNSKLTSNNLGKALRKSAKNGHLAVVQALLGHQRISLR
jgi:hypothetical protein